MDNIVKIVKDIIINNVNDLPLNETIGNDKIVLDKKHRYYKTETKIKIPKHEIEIIQIVNEHYKGRFLFEKKYNTIYSYFLKYGKEIITINTEKYNTLYSNWYYLTEDKRNKKRHIDTMNIVINTMGA